MKKRIKISRRVFLLLALGILVCSVVIGTGLTVRAREQADMQADMQADTQADAQASNLQESTQPFNIDAQMLPSTQSAYEISLKVENKGQDWEGIVRLRIVEDYYGKTSEHDCVYDTKLSLPKGSTKQFAVRIPKDSLDRTDGVVQVTLLDHDTDVAAQREFGRLLQAETDALTMGILSDEYGSLTYLDMGGNEFYFNGKTYPIKLVQLDKDGLEEALETLDYLVIDSYNTGILSEWALESIIRWIDQGGMLILGTGSRADEVLAGFEELEIQCIRVKAPGEDVDASNTYVDVSQLSVAELVDGNNNYGSGYDIGALYGSKGNGAVEVFFYSLAEAAKESAIGDYEQQKSFVEALLRRISNNASFSDQRFYNGDMLNFFYEICFQLGKGSNRLQFGGLKWIVVLYVIFVGPVLYLILRATKKRDIYWIAVPITALVGILLIYWAGRGFEVVSTNVYSVTIEKLGGRGEARTYLRCYDAGHKEWELRLAEGYEYAGPLDDGSYLSAQDSYYYRIQREGERLFFGMNPSIGFEDGYFQAGLVKEPEQGMLSGDLHQDGQKELSGTVTNETKWDFKYFAVWMGDDVYVYKNLPAGAVIHLEETEMITHDNGSYYYFSDWNQTSEMKQDVDAMIALRMGLAFSDMMEDADTAVIVGLTEDWDKAVDDVCSETSYGCLYAVQ